MRPECSRFLFVATARHRVLLTRNSVPLLFVARVGHTTFFSIARDAGANQFPLSALPPWPLEKFPTSSTRGKGQRGSRKIPFTCQVVTRRAITSSTSLTKSDEVKRNG